MLVPVHMNRTAVAPVRPVVGVSSDGVPFASSPARSAGLQRDRRSRPAHETVGRTRRACLLPGRTRPPSAGSPRWPTAPRSRPNHAARATGERTRAWWLAGEGQGWRADPAGSAARSAVRVLSTVYRDSRCRLLAQPLVPDHPCEWTPERQRALPTTARERNRVFESQFRRRTGWSPGSPRRLP